VCGASERLLRVAVDGPYEGRLLLPEPIAADQREGRNPGPRLEAVSFPDGELGGLMPIQRLQLSKLEGSESLTVLRPSEAGLQVVKRVQREGGRPSLACARRLAGDRLRGMSRGRRFARGALRDL